MATCLLGRDTADLECPASPSGTFLFLKRKTIPKECKFTLGVLVQNCTFAIKKKFFTLEMEKPIGLVAITVQKNALMHDASILPLPSMLDIDFCLPPFLFPLYGTAIEIVKKSYMILLVLRCEQCAVIDAARDDLGVSSIAGLSPVLSMPTLL